ncbi:extracellular solute-binding protein [Natronorubrum sp. DTA7]|uniref:extracellular solute-binding protein n=1 Tax=Natronorubrum sp. DTA7 TaxID=3447016 RepID=UPI003F832E28
MPGKHSQGKRRTDSSVSRRTFVKAAGAGGAAVGLAGCIYGSETSEDAIVIGTDPVMIEAVGDEFIELLQDNGADGINIELQAGNEDTGERRDSYTNLLQAGEARPDLLMMDVGWINVFIQRGHIASVDEQLGDDDIATLEDEYFGPSLDAGRDPESGDLYSVPVFPDFPTMQYRKDYAREAGYDDDDFDEWASEPMTWQEWAELTEEITEASDAEYGFATQWDQYEGTACCTWNEVMSSFGGAYFGGRENVLGPVGDRPVTIDEPEFIEGLEMMRTFVADEHDDDTNEDYPVGIASENITSWMEEDAREAILEGDCVMQRNWPYAISLNLDSEDHDLTTDDYGAMPIPYAVSQEDANQPGTGGSTAALGGWNMCLNPNSERTEDAAEVLRAMMADEFYLGMFDIYGWVPPKPDLLETDQAREVEPMGYYLDTLATAGQNAMSRPVTTVWPDQSGLIAEEVNLAVAGDKSPADAAADLQDGLEATEE